MPMTIAKAKTAKGHEYLKIHSFGDVTAADAEALNKTLVPGGENADRAILASVAAGAQFSPEARQAFTRTNGNNTENPKPVAIVVTSAPLRVMLSFIIRMSGAAANTKFFGNEADALAFIEEKMG
jgi:hypothetical protein